MENKDNSNIEDTPIIDTISKAEIALLQSLLITEIESTNGYYVVTGIMRKGINAII